MYMIYNFPNIICLVHELAKVYDVATYHPRQITPTILFLVHFQRWMGINSVWGMKERISRAFPHRYLPNTPQKVNDCDFLGIKY
jgi:hypothetical protein